MTGAGRASTRREGWGGWVGDRGGGGGGEESTSWSTGLLPHSDEQRCPARHGRHTDGRLAPSRGECVPAGQALQTVRT